MLDDDDALEMLAAIGETATVDGEEIVVLFKDAEQVADYQSGQMVRVDPYCLIRVVDVAAHEIHGDPSGTTITIGTTEYRILSVDPNGPLFSVCTLEVNNG